MFSPDYKSAERLPWDMNPKSRRFVDLRDGELQISGDLGDGSRWGRRFDRKATSPVLTETETPALRMTNFIVNVPPDAPVFPDAQKGALEFKVTLGEVDGTKVLKWSSLYAGKGGSFGGYKCPKGDCDNFMVLVADPNPCDQMLTAVSSCMKC